jgi:hypothetical protein
MQLLHGKRFPNFNDIRRTYVEAMRRILQDENASFGDYDDEEEVLLFPLPRACVNFNVNLCQRRGVHSHSDPKP